jgi:DNA repair protein SbcC/Rad50
MRPLRLEIEGLTSFRQRQEIDFAGFDLFVITGPTGAGKTTILDAITLALYGEIPRTGKRNAADLVTHGDTRARVMLEFRADGKTYRVSRVLPRNGAQKATLEWRDGDDWLPVVEESGVRPVNARIEAIIGLDFDGFTRAVLLPQGEFAKFLSGDAGERRDIMVRLLELGRYEKAGQLARQEADGLNSDISAKSRLLSEDYADATKEGVTAAVQAATDTKAHAGLKAKASDNVDQLASRLTDLENQLTSIERGASALGDVGKALDTVAKEWARLQPQEAEIEAALLGAKADFEKAKGEQSKATALLKMVCGRTGDEGVLAALDAACATSAREARTLLEISKTIGTAERDADRLGRSLAVSASELKNAKARHAAAQTAEEASRDQADRITQALRQARERVEAERNVSSLTAESRRWHNELEARRAALKGLETAVRAAEDMLGHLNKEHASIGIRAGLAVGKPCPVCLQLVRKTPASASDIAPSIRAAQDNAQAATRQLREAEGAVTEAISESRVADRSLAQATKTMDQIAGAPLLATAEAEAAALKAKQAKLVVEREEATRLVNETIKEHGKVAEKLAGAKADRESRVREQTAAESRRRRAEKELKAGFPAGIPKDPAGAIAERRRELQAARQSEATARKKFERARETCDQAAASRTKFERQVTDLIKRCAEQRGVLGQLSASCGIRPLMGMKTPRQIVCDEVTVLSEWRGLVAAELDRQRTAAEKVQKRETAALGGVLTTMGLSLATADLPRLRAAVKKVAQEASVAATRAADNAARLKKKLVRRREMETQITGARERECLYRALADELRQNRFIDYLLGESIGQLATLASAELRSISGGRYGLLAERSGFIVVDHANADETRSVDTLSGGETFFASLSLATALARSITDIAGEAIGSRLEAMFIDEGFGALDAETLDAAIDALERFRDSERLVGVITHVSQLAERIPDGLMVEREGASSRIRPR